MPVAIATSVKIVLYPYAFKIRICNRLQNYNFPTNPTICILMDGYDVPNAFIAADGIEYALGNKVPLWLFGFLY